MAAVSTGVVLGISAGIALVGAGTQTYAADQANQASRRAETRAMGLSAEEGRRQKKQESLIAAQEQKTQQAVAGRLRATAGKRSGSRSLIFDSSAGVQPNSQLGTQTTLG
jgi:hypothetical protein